jgi:hypothetical protein
MSNDSVREVRDKRVKAAERWRPERVRTLLVAEAPPQASNRYFYFDNVPDHDDLFRYVVRGCFGVLPDRPEKTYWLERLRNEGIFLIDLQLDPVDGSSLSEHVPNLVSRCRALSPERIILIKVTVYDAAFKKLKAAGLPVVDERIPFPGSGRQPEFEVSFGRALSARPPVAA